jgi:hypothetical protein
MEIPRLSFHPSLGGQLVIDQKFDLPVSHVRSSSSRFFLVASFGQCKFCLCPVSIGLILQVTFGGFASDFDVVQLDDHVFCFSVASKQLGFHIFNLSTFSCSCYKVFFHLWSNGGPRWEFEFADYCKEEAWSWSEVKKLHQPQKTFFQLGQTKISSVLLAIALLQT